MVQQSKLVALSTDSLHFTASNWSQPQLIKIRASAWGQFECDRCMESVGNTPRLATPDPCFYLLLPIAAAEGRRIASPVTFAVNLTWPVVSASGEWTNRTKTMR